MCQRCMNWNCHTCSHLLTGCCAAKKNVCRIHVAADFKPLDDFTYRFSRYIDSMPKEELDNCMGLLQVHDDVNDEDCIIAILDQRLSPKMQYFCWCWLDAGETPNDFFHFPEMPFRIGLSIGTSMMGGKQKALRTITSDSCLNGVHPGAFIRYIGNRLRIHYFPSC